MLLFRALANNMAPMTNHDECWRITDESPYAFLTEHFSLSSFYCLFLRNIWWNSQPRPQGKRLWNSNRPQGSAILIYVPTISDDVWYDITTPHIICCIHTWQYLYAKGATTVSRLTFLEYFSSFKVYECLVLGRSSYFHSWHIVQLLTSM